MIHLAQIKTDFMKERVLIARRGAIAEHETARWRISKTIVGQLHGDITRSRWGLRHWDYVKALPMCRACVASVCE